MIEEIKKRIDIGTELTASEFSLIKDLIKICAPGFAINKSQKRSPKIEIGEKSEKPVNPLTGYEYGYETGAELSYIAKKNNWCFQFAGKSQWESMGRKIIPNEQPAYSYLSIYKKEINLFAYEQTQ